MPAPRSASTVAPEPLELAEGFAEHVARRGALAVAPRLAWAAVLLAAVACPDALPRSAELKAALRTEPAQAGLYHCHMGEQVQIRNLAPDFGSLVLRFRGRDTLLFAVDTESGALRYEDRRSGLTWIKIPGKSMLLDSRMGEPLANDCMP